MVYARLKKRVKAKEIYECVCTYFALILNSSPSDGYIDRLRLSLSIWK